MFFFPANLRAVRWFSSVHVTLICQTGVYTWLGSCGVPVQVYCSTNVVVYYHQFVMVSFFFSLQQVASNDPFETSRDFIQSKTNLNIWPQSITFWFLFKTPTKEQFWRFNFFQHSHFKKTHLNLVTHILFSSRKSRPSYHLPFHCHMWGRLGHAWISNVFWVPCRWRTLFLVGINSNDHQWHGKHSVGPNLSSTDMNFSIHVGVCHVQPLFGLKLHLWCCWQIKNNPFWACFRHSQRMKVWLF